MNTKTILGISLATVFAASMIFAQNAVADPPTNRHLIIDEFNFETFHGMAKVDLRAASPIPNNSGAFGFAVFTDDKVITNNVLSFTGHICAADSPVQGDTANEIKRCPFNPEGSIGVLEFLRDNVSGYDGLPDGQIDQANDGGKIHPHILDLKLMESDCSDALAANNLDAGEGDPVEVDVGNSVENNISPSNYLVKHSGKNLTVGNIPIDDIGGDEVQAVASFNIFPLHDGNSNITNLCLYDVDFQEFS